MSIRLTTGLGVLGILLATAAAADSVPIWIANPGPAVALDVPIRVGVPFSRGEVPANAPMTLRLPSGRRLPAQTVVVERWPDGSGRWLAVDAVLPGLSSGRSTVHLETGTAPSGDTVTPDTVTIVPGEPLTVRTPRLRLSVGAKGTISVRALGTAAPDLVIDPLRIAAPRPGDGTVRTVEVVSAGPVRAEVSIEHVHPGDIVVRTDVVAWGESRTLLLRHRILNAGTAPAAALQAVPIALHLPGVTTATTLVDGTPRPIDVGPGPTRLAQSTPTTAALDGAPIGRHLDGAVALVTRDVALTAVVPDFWQQYPKAFSVSDGGGVIDLFAGDAAPVSLGVGAAKTHEMWLRLEPAAGASPLPTLARLLRDPPRAIADPAWTRASGALRGVVDPTLPDAAAFLGRLRSDALRYESRGRYERWDAGPPGPCAARRRTDVRTGFFGVLDWGDWNFPGYRDDAKGCDAWGNHEYDLPFVFGLAWASTGDAAWGAWFERAVRHYRDVDVIHAAPEHPQWVGLNHPHKVGHFDWRARGNVDLGHVWLEGLLLHARLTGDQRSREAGLTMADRLGTMTAKASNPRHFGWPLTALAAAALATDDAAFRTAALRYAEIALRRFPPDPMAGDWKIGVLASGLAATHRATGDVRLRDWLVRYGEALLAAPQPTELDPRFLAVTGYLAALTGDRRHAAIARSLATDMDIGTWGKTLAMHGRIGFEALAFLPPAMRR